MCLCEMLKARMQMKKGMKIEENKSKKKRRRIYTFYWVNVTYTHRFHFNKHRFET